MKNFYYLSILLAISFCFSFYDERKKEIFMKDKDFVEFERQYSPNNSHLLINYGIDLGAFGYGRRGTAILKIEDTTKNLNDFTLSNEYIRTKWIDNNKISAQIDIIPFIKNGEKVDMKSLTINGINIEVSAFDNIEESFHMDIEHKEVSPDGQKELIAYRYLKNRSNLNNIHVSIINRGDSIPKYGNYLIADMTSDYVFNGTWATNNSLIFYTNQLYKDMVQYALVKTRPKIAYKLIVDDSIYGNKYRWIEKKFE